MEEMDNVNDYTSWIQATFIVRIEILQLNIDNNTSLSCFDWELLTGTFEIAKNSVYLWLPQSMGGLDYYGLAQNGKIESRWSWKNAALSDLAGSATFFMEMGIMGAVGLTLPGTNAAILGGWALSAGLSSALGGFM